MIILGLDPGTATTGYAIVEKKGNEKLTCLTFGCIQTPAGLDAALRLGQIRTQLLKILQAYRPSHASVEQLFFTTNAKTAISVAHARGVVLETLASKGICISEYTPLQVKQAVTGYGKADKHQVQKMVQAILCLEQLPKPNDAADALAIAICCAHSLRPDFSLQTV